MTIRVAAIEVSHSALPSLSVPVDSNDDRYVAAKSFLRICRTAPSRSLVSKTRHQNIALGDRARESRFRWQFPHAEARPYVRNAAISRHFERGPL